MPSESWNSGSTRAHRKWRYEVLERCNYLCATCREHDIYIAADAAHHVVPLAAGGEPLDPSNGIALCKSCHAKAHGKQLRDFDGLVDASGHPTHPKHPWNRKS